VLSVCITIPCYNAERWIARCITSVLDQEWPELEVIVVDDGSTDGTLRLAESFGKKVRCYTGTNRGACAARNRGLELSTADYILFLDADDYLDKASLSAWMRTAAQTGADLVLAPFAYETGARRTLGKKPVSPVSPQSVLCHWLKGRFTPPCSVMWRRAFVASIGGWNPNAIRNQDGELVMRALLSQARVSVASEGLGIYVQHDSPTRVSRRSGRDVVACELALLSGLWELAKQGSFKNTQSSFARAFYRIAYESFSIGVNDVGRSALTKARNLGRNGYIGTMVHLSNIFGLRLKLRLTGLLRGRARRRIGS